VNNNTSNRKLLTNPLLPRQRGKKAATTIPQKYYNPQKLQYMPQKIT